MIKAVGHRILVKPYKQIDVDPIKKQHAEFLATLTIAGNENLKREDQSVDKGIVLQVGNTAWLEFGNGEPWCKIGDEIIFAKFGGKFITEDGTDYVILNDEDVVAISKEAA